MRTAHLGELRTIAEHCDGVRCDMAMLQLNEIFAGIWGKFLHGAKPPKEEFWTEVRRALPDLVLLAEAYWGTEGRLLELGFQFVYDKALYHAARDSNLHEIHSRLAADAAYQKHMARFLENHDEARQPTAFGTEKLAAVGTFMGTLPGMRFYYQGELEGRKVRLPISLRRAQVPPDPIASAFFEKILKITNEEAFHTGVWTALPANPENDPTSGNPAVYEWKTETSWKLVVVNLAGIASQARIPLGSRVAVAKQYMFFDQLNDVRYVRDGAELSRLGLFVRRERFQAHLFDIAAM
jgi:hypothetical protein